VKGLWDAMLTHSGSSLLPVARKACSQVACNCIVEKHVRLHRLLRLEYLGSAKCIC
jgi:hypothetical protein